MTRSEMLRRVTGDLMTERDSARLLLLCSLHFELEHVGLCYEHAAVAKSRGLYCAAESFEAAAKPCLEKATVLSEALYGEVPDEAKL